MKVARAAEINSMEILADQIAAVNMARSLKAGAELSLRSEARFASNLQFLCRPGGAELRGNTKGIAHIYVALLEKLMMSWEPYQIDRSGFRVWRVEQLKMANALQRAESKWRLRLICPEGYGPGEDRWISDVTTFRQAAIVAAYLAFHRYLVDRDRRPFSSCRRASCQKVYLAGRKTKYCSSVCAKADSANNTHKQQSREDNLSRLHKTTTLLNKWIAYRSLQKVAWRKYVTDRSAEITPNWLTRYSAFTLATATSAADMRTLLGRIGFVSERDGVEEEARLEAVVGRFRISIEKADALQATARNRNGSI